MAQTPVIVRGEADSIPYTPSTAVAAGAVIVQGTLVGVAPLAIAADEKGALCVRCVADVPKDNGNMATPGTAIYWDADGTPVGGSADGAFTLTPTGNTFAGWHVEAAGTTVGTVRALILSSFAVSVTTVDALTDVGTVDYTAGDILIADGAKFECLPLSGAYTLSAAGRISLKVNASVAVGGTAIGNANAVAEGMTIVTGADDTAAVKLPVAVAGMKVVIISTTASKNLIVFPQVNSAIDALGANNAFNSATDAPHLTFEASSTTQWYCTAEKVG